MEQWSHRALREFKAALHPGGSHYTNYALPCSEWHFHLILQQLLLLLLSFPFSILHTKQQHTKNTPSAAAVAACSLKLLTRMFAECDAVALRAPRARFLSFSAYAESGGWYMDEHRNTHTTSTHTPHRLYCFCVHPIPNDQAAYCFPSGALESRCTARHSRTTNRMHKTRKTRYILRYKSSTGAHTQTHE